MASCNRCDAPIRWGQDVLTKRWIALDPDPVPLGRFAFRSAKGIVDLTGFPPTFEEIPPLEVLRLPAVVRARLKTLYQQERYQAHRTASCPLPVGVASIRVPLREILQQLGEVI